jgi:hypothetical protein
VAIVNDVAVLIAGIDGFAVFVALSALENLVNVRRAGSGCDARRWCRSERTASRSF